MAIDDAVIEKVEMNARDEEAVEALVTEGLIKLQVEAELELPPEQVKLLNTLKQLVVQLREGPGSHVSEPTNNPSPQMGEQEALAVLQAQPVSV